MQALIIIGTGGFAREVHWLVQEINAAQPCFEVLGFVGPADPGNLPAPYLGSDAEILQQDFQPSKPSVIVALGDGKLRSKLLSAYAAGGYGIASLVHPTAKIGLRCQIDEGAIICAGAILTVDIAAGPGLVANLNSTIGHDCQLGDCVTLSPGCHLSGGTVCGDGVSLGTGAVTLPNTRIGAHSQVGAGAVVTRDLPENVVATGIPAKETRKLVP